MSLDALDLRANWTFEESGQRRHYVIEAWLDGRLAGRAHGWFEPGGPFVMQKIEMDRRQRSKGYGSAVIAQLREKAREKHCDAFVIENVRANNLRAIRLYESLGAIAREPSGAMLTFVIAPP